jgi:hypothetical protein
MCSIERAISRIIYQKEEKLILKYYGVPGDEIETEEGILLSFFVWAGKRRSS